MTINKLQRVMQRLGQLDEHIALTQLRRAIMREIGTDERTIKTNIAKLKELGYLKRLTRHTFKVTWEYEF